MEAPLHGRVSLRGASAREDSRDALLEKVARDRATRGLLRRMAAAALTIQRIWRGARAARIAVDAIQRRWDARVLEIRQSGIAQDFASEVLRPFVFFTRHLSSRTRIFHARDLQRVAVCFQLVLQSISFPDERNFCTLCCGTASQKTQWQYQVHRLITICSAILTGRRRSDSVSNPVLALSMRLLVTLTDSKMWSGFQNQQREAGAVTLDTLQWFGAGNSGFYYAAHAYIMDSSTEDAESKDGFLVMASLVTMAFRPLHAIAAEGVSKSSDERYARDLEDWKGKAAAEICRYILAVPCLIERLPAGLVPAFHHPNVLPACLRACKVGTWSGDFSAEDDNVPHAAWRLANVVSIVSIPSCELSEGIYSEFVEAACCLLRGLRPWVEALREKKRILENRDSGGDTEDYADLQPRCSDSLQQLIRLLKPLYDQRQVLRLLGKTGSSSVGLPAIAKLYSYLLTAFSVLNHRGGALPVLNVLAFTKDLHPQLWSWFASCMQLQIVKPPETRATIPVKEQSSRQISSKLANTFLRKTKSASSESVCEVLEAQWHIDQLKDGPGVLSEAAVSVLTLFCTLYAHLLLVLDDTEFYDKQVPFSIDEQRLICATLNTMLYHGFCSPGRSQFTTLMEAATRCLRALYERDSRRSFCSSALWLAPAEESRPAIAAAARAHEAASVSAAGEASAMGSILTTMPHVLPFEERVQIFREFINSDKTLRKIEGEVVGPGPGSIEISVRRDRIVEDGLQQLNALGARIKGCINVSFVNEYGLAEAGLDYGGLFKEFLTDLAKAAFDPGYGLFLQTATEERLLFPHPAASNLHQGLRTMEFLGRIVGKALYEGILLEHLFSPVFVAKILGRYSPIDDLASLDIELHRNLMYLKNYEGDVSDMALDFTVTEEHFGKRKIIDLVQGGSTIPVTDSNKLQYVHALADYKLNRQVRPVVSAFVSGLTDLISPNWLGLFNAKEFNQLLSGEEHDFDVSDLKANTRYTGGYSCTSRTVKLFWEVLEQLDVKESCAVLKFVTSCSRAPLLGFKHLQPPFTIHKVTCDTPVWTFLAGQDVDRLPTASTCYNILKLPAYRRLATLREKLQYAIRSNSGFELS